ncbi:hypothetical protein ACHAWF_018386 [Thalassiosira exigua]
MKSIIMPLAIAASQLQHSSAAMDWTIQPHMRMGALSAGFVPIQPQRRHSTRYRRVVASFSTNPQDPTVAVVDEMPPSLPPLKNYYYLLRHGQSTANVAGIISSARSLAGSTKHGLTLLGIQQGKDSAASLIDLIAEDLTSGEDGGCGLPDSTRQVYFYSSPFARAKETAEACLRGIKGNEEVAKKVKTLGLEVNDEISLDDGLMERFFGRLDGQALSTYAYVWPVDMFEPTHTGFDVESVAAVSTRVRDTLLNIDSQHTENGGGNHIVLTSHADVLQITQVYAAGLVNVGKFSQYRFGNGEVRRLGREVDTLPEAQPLQPPQRGQ